MSLPRKQNRDEDEPRVPHVLTRQSVERKKVGLRNSGAANVAKFSRLSAQMVELSLQQAQRDPFLHDPLPAKPNAVSSPLHDSLPAKPNAVSSPLPLPWPAASAAPLQPPQLQGTAGESKAPNYWKQVRSNLDNWLAGARVSGSAAVRSLGEHVKSLQKKFTVPNLKIRYGTASRLWTSTGVAALSAILVVGVIFGVRHYVSNPDTLQHRGRNASPVIPAMQDTSQPRRSSVLGTNRAAAMQHPARSSTAKHVPAEQGVRKVRRKNKGDDYVAKDTYVYYGTKGKPAQ